MQTATPPPSPVVEMSFHHVGVAVKSIDAALGYYTGLFGLRQVTEPLEVPGERVKVCFVEAPPGVLIELVEGLGDKSPVADVVARTGAGPYHICYRVADLDDAVRRLRAAGCFRIKRFERPAAPGLGSEAPKRFAFLLTPDRQLFELCEAQRRETEYREETT